MVVIGLVVQSYGWRAAEPRRTLNYLMDIAVPPPAARQVPVEAPAPPPPARRGRPLVFQAGPATTTPSAEPRAPIGEDSLGLANGARDGRSRPGRLLALNPRTGDPRLWVRPMIIPEGGGRPISLDSAVRMRLLAMADSLQKNPTIDPLRLPSWTFTRDGKTYGLDAQGMHFGTFTVPTAVLAFLPLPQGNIDQARANAALMAMRADLLRAAARAQAEEDFRRAVREIRERKDRERREQRDRDANRPRPTP